MKRTAQLSLSNPAKPEILAYIGRSTDYTHIGLKCRIQVESDRCASKREETKAVIEPLVGYDRKQADGSSFTCAEISSSREAKRYNIN
jgi:hypothetical protein